MPLITDPDDLSQGASTAAAQITFTGQSGNSVTINSGNATLPAVADNDFIEVRDHSDSQNNGLYQVNDASPTTSAIDLDKVSGANPVNNAVQEGVTVLGNTTTEKSVFFDTQVNELYLIEQGNLDSDGVPLQVLYSFTKEEWKDDSFLIQFPFPFVSITPEQFEIGTDGQNANGWVFEDNATFSIRTRKLLRTGGWSEIDDTGALNRQYVGVITLGTFEDAAADTAYYQFGTDTTVNDTVDFDFAGPVDEAILSFEEYPNPTGNYAFTTTTITRSSGSFITDGYKVGGQVTIRNAEDSGNNGSFTLTAVTATVLTTSGLTANADDSTALLAADNRNALTLRLRIRDADPNGKTFDQSDLAAIGLTTVTNKAERFPLANATDLKISATDADMSSAPYNDIDITFHSTPQSLPVGASSFDFGIVIDGNVDDAGGNASVEEIYERIQFDLRQTTDIDADADTNIGRSIAGLLSFVGDTLHVGSPDGGTTFAVNPDGGGSGVYIEDFDANDTNRVVFYDNTGTARTFPFVAAGTINFNANLVNDSMGVYTMFFEYTTRTTITDLVIDTVSGSQADINSAGGLLPTFAVNDYFAFTDFTGGEIANNGVWQITAINVANQDYTAVKVDGDTVVAVTSSSHPIDERPIDSPTAVVVDDNSDVDISGNITGASLAFDFDYDGNNQAGRTPGTDAAIVIRAIGLETAQFVEVTGTITRNVGLVFSLVSALERNYTNP